MKKNPNLATVRLIPRHHAPLCISRHHVLLRISPFEKGRSGGIVCISPFSKEHRDANH